MKMDYFVLGTNNMEAAVSFYDALFMQTAFKQTFATDRMTYWQGEDMDAAFAVAIPFDGEPATKGNGTMLGFRLALSKDVEELHRKTLALGGRCEGEPGLRGPRYSAYVRDLDGNKLCFSSEGV